jgi:ferredoxin
VISCGDCSCYCQVGIDVVNFALTQEDLNSKNSSCIGCGLCVTVCPMDILSFGDRPQPTLVQIEDLNV